MDLESEKIIIEKCKKDLIYFEEIYKAYIDDVFRFSMSKLFDRNLAEDITSETFFIALEKIQSFESDQKSIKSWLFTIARNKIINLQTSKQSQNTSLDENFEGSIDEKILDKLADEEIIDRAKKVILSLKPPIPEIMQLKLWDDLTFKEISKILDKSESAIKMAYYRGIERIQSELKL